MMMSNIASVNAGPIEREQAKRIHDRLTGVPPDDTGLDFMESLIVNNGTFEGATGAVAAARYAMAAEGTGSSRAKYFYNVTLKNWVTPWTNEEQTMFAPLNDYTALVIGMIRDDLPFNTVLSADLFYTGIGGGLPAFSNMNNDHFEALENNDVDLSRSSLFDSRPQNNLNGAPAGIVTTRQAGKAFFSEGTNRAMFRFTSMNYLCRDLEDLKDVTRVPDRIRQDVSRSPGGDSSIFLNSCVGCHAGMDPLAGAYAYYEWVEDADGNNGHVIYTPGDVQPKHHINSTNFEHGYRTVDDGWLNYWRQGPNAGLGWAGTAEVTSGNGAASMGQELANTEAFAQCQVEKVYKQVCLQEPISNHNADIATLTSRFMDTGDMNYRMKNLFAEVAALCMGN
ncbi:MAG: hypothetical protein AMJ55_08650 [Gammaproteobacteria bacterium SG8_15]|nr:MAG: hypothetical protein AMJ55_08650 [Gammaproteobacteria bacterium SG8_15]